VREKTSVNLKTVLGVATAMALAVLAGWMWGASGKAAVTLERRVSAERADFAEARADLLDARLSLLGSNFGDAAKSLDRARRIIADVQVRLRETGQAERAGRVEIVLSRVRDAERLAAALDRTAADAAAQALQALPAVQK
jgi:hypothetical protein